MSRRVPTLPVSFQMPVAEVEAIEAAAFAAKLSRASWCKAALRAALTPTGEAGSQGATQHEVEDFLQSLDV